MAQYSSGAAGAVSGALAAADREVDSLYAAIKGRKAFSYNPNTDPMYRSYADRYVQDGRMAMRHSMGQAAALTGGYGSSYSQSVGQQQYDEYLRSLSQVLPELYGLAWQQYSEQGAALRDAYDMARQRQQTETARQETAYQRSRDALADKRYEAQQAEAARQTAYKQMQTAYTNLVKLISTTGYQPDEQQLQEAGLSRAQAEALRQEYLRANGLLPGSGGGGGGGGGGYRRSSSSDSARRTGKATAAGITGANAQQAVSAARSGGGVSTGGGGGGSSRIVTNSRGSSYRGLLV